MARKNGVRRSGPLPEFEKWTPPWGDDEQFDAEKAKKLIYDLHADKETLFTQIDERDTKLSEIEDERDDLLDEVDTLKDAKPADKAGAGDGNDQAAAIAAAVEAALAKAGVTGEKKSRKEQRKEAEAANKGNSGDDLRADRLEIALEKGLTKAQAARLSGSTREELEADADAYIEEHGLGGGESNTGGQGGQAPPSQRPQTARTASSQRQRDVDPDDNLDPGALYDKVFGKGAPV